MKPQNMIIKPKKHIANFVSYAIVMVLGVLIVTVLFQSYQISSRLMSQEVKRTSRQTSNLVQSLFDYRLSTVQIHQDSSAQSQSLVKMIEHQNLRPIDQYFNRVDQREITNTPDIRFITTTKGQFWDDGNAQFYGIAEHSLHNIISRVAFNSNWHLIATPSQLNTMYLLIRRSPMVDQKTGEVSGYLYVGIVLNNNYALLETMRDGSNSESLILTVGSHVLATTLSGSEAYSAADIVQSKQDKGIYNEYMVSRATLMVEGVSTYLKVYSVQNNHNALSLRNNYYFWMAFALVAMVIVAFLTRWWLQRRIESEISSLMSYTHQVAKKGDNKSFPGSLIYEFDHFGRTLENTFSRLAEQEKQFEDLFNYTTSPMLLWGADGSLIKMNPSAKEEFLNQYENGESLFTMLAEQLQGLIQDTTRGHLTSSVLTELGSKMFRWNLSPITVNNEIQSVIAQGHDITTIIEAEKQSRIARKEAEESAKLRADFLAQMSHELRTPLNGILGVSQLLQRTVETKEQIEQVKVLCSSGEHLLAVLSDILDFSRIEQGKFTLKPTEFRLADLAMTIQQIYYPLCRDEQLTLEVNTDIPHTMYVRNDQVRINQILFNLLNNATKFTHEGGITVDMHINDSTSPLSLDIKVSDTGIGISEEDLRVVFEPFMQAGTPHVREYGGSGLGLAIVKNLLTMLEGHISVTSRVNQGTQFTLSIPLDVVVPSKSLPTPDSDVIDFTLFNRQLSVLLVEDNHTNAFIAKAFCEKYNIKTDWVTDGYKAIEKLQTQHFDLVLMDNQLPQLGGVEATARIKQELQLPVVVYACTADGMDATRDAFFAAGADYVLVKPIKEISLYRALQYFKNQHLEST
ncbi:quorum-sensing autoinducer 2 sensor kinase/phosphatase LuxQ [Vibrio palustris]|uniref:Autoinducer 2 sensor kinase/phosphatase LuxQ n=1 Tax=Vibrio palustris TaxID=1918946 RepID=A0A1R4B707_9VIBR|nr:quorum-sensing autoinducer 2 sensor kinase/phosphatase LuxQ [Vibrio palustris]SJL84676.1 Autoinducer 2 sensor kinase/phosphatase LuxQ [Vibrio palustris]